MNDDKILTLSLGSKICQTLQLDTAEVLNTYKLKRVKPEAKHQHFEGPVTGWLDLVADLLDRSSGNYDPDCSIPKSLANRVQLRVTRAAEK